MRETTLQWSLSSSTSEENGARTAQCAAKPSTRNHPPQATRGGLSYAKATTSGVKNAQRRNLALTEEIPPPPSLIGNPGSGSKAPSPSGEATQGPSPVDYSLEIEAIFPFEMVIEMQKCAMQKACKTVIGRTLGGRVPFKALQDCLKLHLPVPFSIITLLTRGYFEILFEDEEGARATRKLAAIEWSGWALSFSKYTTDFRPNEQGAEMFLTHSVKVQFPDLHVQFRTTRALTIMASTIGEVLDIESPESYIKRPARPMIIVEGRDISKLARIIKIPSMAEGARPGDMTAQRILYFRLLNQCRRCQKFGHLTKACPFNRSPTQEGGLPANLLPDQPGKIAPRKHAGAQCRSSNAPSKTGSQ